MDEGYEIDLVPPLAVIIVECVEGVCELEEDFLVVDGEGFVGGEVFDVLGDAHGAHFGVLVG